MKTRALILFVSLALVLNVAGCINSTRTVDGPEVLDTTLSLAPGVIPVSFNEGKASAPVRPGDIVAVFSTASDTEQTFIYSIMADRTGSASSPENSPVKATNPADYQPVVQTRPSDTEQFDAGSGVRNQEIEAVIGSRETFWTWELTDISKYPEVDSVQFTGVLKAIGEHCDVFID